MVEEMRTGPFGLSIIKEFEGFREKAYQDVVGVWTVGYGHTSAIGAPVVRAGMLVTKTEGEAILKRDLRVGEDFLNKAIDVDLTQGQFDALSSWVFNVGIGAAKNSTLIRILNQGNYEGVSAQLMRWNKAGGRVVRGLTRRRAAEAKLWAESTIGAGIVEDARIPAEEDTGKPLSQSTTIWTAVAGYVVQGVTALSALDWKVAIPVLIVGAALTVWIVRERMKKSRDHGV